MTVSCCIFSVVNVTACPKVHILAMSHNNFAQFFSAHHSFTHKVFVVESYPVIAECNYIRCHGLKVSKFSATFPYGDSSVRNYVYHCILFYNVKLFSQVLLAVRYRVQIRHGAYPAVTALCCRQGS